MSNEYHSIMKQFYFKNTENYEDSNEGAEEWMGHMSYIIDTIP